MLVGVECKHLCSSSLSQLMEVTEMTGEVLVGFRTAEWREGGWGVKSDRVFNVYSMS